MRSARKRTKIVINVTSLIDVVFLLLIFFLVTSTFSEQPALKISLPRSSTSGSGNKEELVLAVSRNGNLYLDQNEVTRSELPGLLADAARNSEDSSLVLRADRRVSYGLIVEIMDISRRVGLENIVAMTESDTGSRSGPGIDDLLRKNEGKEKINPRAQAPNNK
ncbi:MAG: biopolymer transporter ExbD [Candidatus Auribacterota bacterium]|nr:biopolymer transporter ExbD [Candidatus Auribacterota bacterium]